MKRFSELIILALIIGLSGCGLNEDTVEERYPVQPNEGDFSGCYYFDKHGDAYDLVLEVYANPRVSIHIVNDEELVDAYSDLSSEPYSDVEDKPNQQIFNRCEVSNLSSLVSRFPTNITDDTIDAANDAIRDFEFRIALNDSDTNESITYDGKLDLIEE